jgi:hypothetical protein
MQNNLDESFKEWKESITQYITTRYELHKLEMANNLAQLASSYVTKIVLLYFLLLALFFMSLSLGFYIGSLLDSNALGFFLTGCIYILLMIIFYAMRKTIVEKPVIKAFIRLFFQKHTQL